MTLAGLLEQVAADHAGSIAITGAGGQLSYAQLRQCVTALSDHLSELGIAGNDTVAILIPNSATFAIAFLAVARHGGIAFPLNILYRETELGYYLDDAKPRLIVTIPILETVARTAAASAPASPRVLVVDEQGRPMSESTGSRSVPASVSQPAPIRPEHPVLCLYSSGSTGRPKRVVRTHANLVFELRRLRDALDLQSGDRFLGAVPFSHVNGLVRTLLGALSVGATIAPMAEFKRREAAAIIVRERITVIIAVPVVFSALGDTVFNPPVDFSALRLCVSASAPLPVSTSRRFHERHGVFVRQLYGSTETGSISINLGPIEDSLDSVGLPLEGVSIRILREDGSIAAANEQGEVAVSSPAAATGYAGSNVSSEAFRDGYYMTGDIGRLDERGRLYLVGRKSWFINRAGYKVNPWELETLLQAHPKVEDVAIVGVPTASGDEMVKAVIVPRGTCSTEEIIEFCRGKIADFKLPGSIEFRPRLPRTVTGKIIRRELA